MTKTPLKPGAALAAAVVFGVAALLSVAGMEKLLSPHLPEQAVQIVKYLPPLLALGLVFFAVRRLDVLRLRGGRLWGLGALLPAACGLVLFAIGIATSEQVAFHGFGPLALFVLGSLLVATFEELVFRGGVFTLLVSALSGGGSTPGSDAAVPAGRASARGRAVFRAAVLSSLVFGLAHLINLIAEPTLVLGTIGQVIYSTFLGFFCVTLFIMGRTLWIAVAAHGMFNIFGSLITVFVPAPPQPDPAVPAQDASLLTVAIQLAVTAPMLLWAIWAWRSRRAAEAAEAWGHRTPETAERP